MLVVNIFTLFTCSVPFKGRIMSKKTNKKTQERCHVYPDEGRCFPLLDTHHCGLRSMMGDMLLHSRDVLSFCGRLGLQDVRLYHLQVSVLGGDVAILEGDEDGASVLAGEPLLCLQGGVGAGRVGVQVVLEQIRLDRWKESREHVKGNVRGTEAEKCEWKKNGTVNKHHVNGLTLRGTVMMIGSHFLSCNL